MRLICCARSGRSPKDFCWDAMRRFDAMELCNRAAQQVRERRRHEDRRRASVDRRHDELAARARRSSRRPASRYVQLIRKALMQPMTAELMARSAATGPRDRLRTPIPSPGERIAAAEAAAGK